MMSTSTATTASLVASLLTNNNNSKSSTIYHSPQSSPSPMNECQSPSMVSHVHVPHATELMTMLNRTLEMNNEQVNNTDINSNGLDDDDKPLDFSSKSSSISPNPMTKKTAFNDNQNHGSIHKKVHPKFLASKHHQQTAEHCFTTPSPSPPEHRISSAISSSSPIMNSLRSTTPPSKNDSNSGNNNENGYPTDNSQTVTNVPTRTNHIFDINKFMQEIGQIDQSHHKQTNGINSATTNPILNEAFLNQALKLAKLSAASTSVSTSMDPSMVTTTSNTSDQTTNSATAQLISLLSAASSTANQQHHSNGQSSLGFNLHSLNHQSMDCILLKNSLCSTEMKSNVPISPIKPIINVPSIGKDHSPQSSTLLNHLVNQHVLSETSGPSQSALSIPSALADGGLLTTASNTTANPSFSSPIDLQHNRTSPTSTNSTTGHIKYQRPFKALYNNKDLKEYLLNSANKNNVNGPQFPLDSLAAQSFLNSDQTYQMFCAQMMNNNKQRPTPSSSVIKSGRRSSKGSSPVTSMVPHPLSINSNASVHSNHSTKSDNNSDDNSSNSSFGTMNYHSPVQASTGEAISNSNNSSQTLGSAILPVLGSGLTSTTPLVTTATNSTNGSRKRGRPLPDDQKDEAYWERRRKNNEAAKRSRDLRRAKEDQIAIRACFLEQENRHLKCELMQVKLELEKVKTLLTTLQNTSPTANIGTSIETV